jgi:hypothetical protein
MASGSLFAVYRNHCDSFLKLVFSCRSDCRFFESGSNHA